MAEHGHWAWQQELARPNNVAGSRAGSDQASTDSPHRSSARLAACKHAWGTPQSGNDERTALRAHSTTDAPASQRCPVSGGGTYAPSGAGRPESAPIRAQRGRHSTPIACGPPRSSGRPRFAPTSMLFWLTVPSPRRPAQRNRAVSGQASHWGDGGRRGARLRGGAARAGGVAHRLARWLHRTRLGGGRSRTATFWLAASGFGLAARGPVPNHRSHDLLRDAIGGKTLRIKGSSWGAIGGETRKRNRGGTMP